MALDNETRDYVDKKFEKTLDITKDRIEDCSVGKLLNDRLHNQDRRLNEMNGEIVHLAEQTTQAVDSIKAAAQSTKDKNEKEKSSKNFQVILTLANFVIVLILVIVGLK